MKPFPAAPAVRSPTELLAEARHLQGLHGPRVIVSAMRRIARRLMD